MSAQNIATLLLYVLKSDNTSSILSYTGIEKERERLKRVIESKSDSSKNSLTFGGSTILGNFISPLMEMGHSYSEILYERSYSLLRLMLADKVVSIYMTDEDLKKLPLSLNSNIIDGNSPDAIKKVQSLFAGKEGVKFN